MPALRVVAMGLIAAVIALGVVAEQDERIVEEIAAPMALATPRASATTWFCPGGSGPGGQAAVALELVNVGPQTASADVVVVRDDVVGGGRTLVEIDPGDRVTVSIAELAVEAAWLGAVIEVDQPDVVVEQTYDGLTGIDRAPCATRTAQRLVVSDGATRVVAEGEQMVLLLLNPFQEAAVVDIAFDADVGPDSLSAVVIPARRLVAIDVTAEVTVASRVSAIVEVRSGRVVGTRIQTRTGTARGLAVTPMVQDGSVVSVVPSIRSELGLTDRVIVTNPGDEIAEVDLEVVTDGSAALDPVELTVRPGRTVVVDTATEPRLAVVPEFGFVARSLSGVPVAVGIERLGALDTDIVSGMAAMPAIDAASTRWIAPLDGATSAVVLVNPSVGSIATADLSMVTPDGSTVVTTVELGPGRRVTVDGARFGNRPIVLVEANAPIVVAREIAGLTSRQMMGAVAAADLVALDQIS